MKANIRFRKGYRYHAIEHDFEIPFKDRKNFMGHNKDKWVSEKKYKKYLKWKKRQAI